MNAETGAEVTLVPRACDVAVAAVPASAKVRVMYPSGGERVIAGDPEFPLTVAVPGDRRFLGWGVTESRYQDPEAITRTCRVEHQAVWREAAVLLGSCPVVYVEHQRAVVDGMPGWAPVSVRPAGDGQGLYGHCVLGGSARIQGVQWFFRGCACGWTSFASASDDEADGEWCEHADGVVGSPGDGPAAVFHARLASEPREDKTLWTGCACGWVDAAARVTADGEDAHRRHMELSRRARAEKAAASWV